MPGHFLRFECKCGLTGGSSPGFDVQTLEGFVTVYDGERIRTEDTDLAKLSGVTVIQDPFIEGSIAQQIRRLTGRLECPACGKKKMKCRIDGYWD